MGDPALANGSQELPGPGVPKAVDGGRRSATVMLPLLPHPEGEASRLGEEGQAECIQNWDLFVKKMVLEWLASLGPVLLFQGKSSSVARLGDKETVLCANGAGVTVQGPFCPWAPSVQTLQGSSSGLSTQRSKG